MRVHLLLILFSASTILARSARDRRDTATTVLPLSTSTNAASNANTTTGVSTNGDDCNTFICRINNVLNKPFKMSSELIRSMLHIFKKTLETALTALTTTSDAVLRVTMQPFLAMIKLAIWVTNWMLQRFF